METTEPAQTSGATPIQKVEVVSQPSFQERLRSAIGPYLEFLGVGSFVLILVLFMLMSREDLSDRIVGLFGQRQVSLTTRTMEEIGQRISRYLATFALVNSGFGLVVGARALGDRRALRGPLGVAWRRCCGSSRTSGRRWRSSCRWSSRSPTSRAGPAAGGRRPLRGGRGAAQQLPGAGHLRQDDGGLGPGPAGRRHVLDLALGDARAAALDPADGLPGGAGQVRPQPGVLRDAPGRGVPSWSRTSDSTSGSWRWTGTARSRSSRRR